MPIKNPIQAVKTIEDLKDKVNHNFFTVLKKEKYQELRPSQIKAINAGLFEKKNLLVCTPTGSGKTFIAELAALNSIYSKEGKAIYIVPLKSLATEKYQLFTEKYPEKKIALSIGDTDSSDSYLETYDLIITTSEKLDSLIRHHAPWLKYVKVVIIDEIHLLNEQDRGPTLEIVITILRHVLKNIQLIGLSATIGNPKELAAWLDATLVEDSWRPVKLYHGTYLDGKIEFYE
ncbi:DEAD/DEAH box helicase [Candidatus Woesearchaeota archaeon]|nr:DEAD/DEAH box helicase [Candidatus Woesearchaeota archaeon]